MMRLLGACLKGFYNLITGGYHRFLNRAISFLSKWGMRDMGLLKVLECSVLPGECKDGSQVRGRGHWLGCIVSGRKNKLKKSMVTAIISNNMSYT